MVHAPTTWVAPGARGCLQVFVVGTDHAGNSALWQLQTTPSNGSPNWYALARRWVRTGCAGPQRSPPAQVGV
jgi:hypothetical protein